MGKRSKARHASERLATAVATPRPSGALGKRPEHSTATLKPTPTKSHVVIAGLSGPALERLSSMLGAIPLAELAEEGLPSDVVLFEGALSGLETILQEQPAAHVIALYQSPWEAVLSVSEERLSYCLPEWLTYHSGLLRLRQQASGRLQLVNAKRLDDSAQLLFEDIASTTGESKVFDAESCLTTNSADRSAALRAKSFEWMAPEYWDVYEALESCAWLGNGEPEYRDSLPALDPNELVNVISGWRQALYLPRRLEATEAQLVEQKDAAQRLEQELSSRLRVAEDRARESFSENEKLLGQLHQVQESLESTFIQGQQAAKDAAAARTRLEQDKAVLAEQVKKLENELAKSGEAAKSVAAEKTKLLAKVDQLESALATGGEVGKALATEKTKLLAEVDRLTKELAKSVEVSKAAEAKLKQNSSTRDEQERALRTTIASLESRAKEAESEAELLLLQLHEVQEQLERYFLKSQDATRALERSTESFNRARRVVAQLIKLQAA